MEKFKPKGEISRNLEASENRGLQQFSTCCQEQSIYDIIYCRKLFGEAASGFSEVLLSSIQQLDQALQHKEINQLAKVT